MLPARIKQEQAALILAGGLAFLLVVWLFATVFISGQKTHPAPSAASPTPFQPGERTLTPFQPVAPTPTATQTTSPTPLPKPNSLPSSMTRFGIDFSDTSQTIQTILSPSQATLNAGKDLRMTFRPGWPCEWINNRACTSLHYQGRVVLVTIHSGVGGDGQALRHALEGTWLNAAALSMQQVLTNLAALQDAPVLIKQSEEIAEGLRVLAAVRVPAVQLEAYFSLPVDEALDFAAQSSAELTQALASGQPILVIETCGWHHPEEPYAPGVTGTSASIYLVIIGEPQ